MRGTVISPLVQSIGAVGLVVGSLVAAAYLGAWPFGERERPGPTDPGVELSVEPFKPKATEPWEQAREVGWAAAVAAQTAHTQAEWKVVGDRWLQAVAILKQMPQTTPEQTQAAAKIREYLANFEQAEARRAIAPTESTASTLKLSAAMVRASLERSSLAFRFDHQVGRSTDGLARIDLTGAGDRLSQIQLVVAGTGAPPSMAQMVYTHQLLGVIAPQEPTAQVWLANNFKRLRANPKQPITSTYGTQQLQLRTEADGHSIAVIITAPE